MSQRQSSTDTSLAKRLESGHAACGLAYARAYQAQSPDSLVAFEEIGGGWAIFQSTDSPVTQALNVGMGVTVTIEEFARLLDFFHSRNTAAIIDLCVLADASVLSLIQQRKHSVREFSNVLARSLNTTEHFDQAVDQAPEIAVSKVLEGEERNWSRLVLRGFTEQEEITEEQIAAVSLVPPTLRTFFGDIGGDRASAAAMELWGGLATFVGDATLPHARRSGLQLALINHRLREAAQSDCDLASVSVIPGSISHRNYERAGFELVYTRIQFALEKDQS